MYSINKCHGNVRINHNDYPLLYKQPELLAISSGRFLECWKYNILVPTQTLINCLICLHSPLGAVRPQASCLHIRQCTHACITTINFKLSWIITYYSVNITINLSNLNRNNGCKPKYLLFYTCNRKIKQAGFITCFRELAVSNRHGFCVPCANHE